jgi:hypothetical protein
MTTEFLLSKLKEYKKQRTKLLADLMDWKERVSPFLDELIKKESDPTLKENAISIKEMVAKFNYSELQKEFNKTDEGIVSLNSVN